MKNIICRLALLSSLLCVGASAQTVTRTNIPPSVTLAWNQVSGVAGYNVYQGPAEFSYTNMVHLAGVTNTITTFTNLVRGGTYVFAATSLASSGLESEYSMAVSYSVPTNPPAPTVAIVNGQ